MKIKIFCIIFLAFFASCSKSDNNDTRMDSENMDMTDDGTTNSPTTYSGNFISAAHTTSGMATINESHTILGLTNFVTSNGPLVEVYLATDLTAANYISLGELQGINGNYDYNLPANVDFENYKYVIIWCVDFSVNFGYAELE